MNALNWNSPETLKNHAQFSKTTKKLKQNKNKNKKNKEQSVLVASLTKFRRPTNEVNNFGIN